MKHSLSLVAFSVAIVCSQNVLAQSATVTVTDATNQTNYGSGGSSVTGTAGGTPNVTTTVSNGTNISTVSQTATQYEAAVGTSGVRLLSTGAYLLHTNGSATVNSGFGSSENAATSGTFQIGTGRQYNGTYSVYDAASSTNLTQIGSYSATNALTSGLQVNGTTGTNTLLGSTVTNGIANTGNISTGTLTVTGASTLAGINNGNGGITNAGAISGVTTLDVSGLVSAGSLSVAGATATNGIANTGNIATATLNTSGNTSVGGNLAVTGTTSTNGIDNNGKVISNVAPGVASSDAATVGQLTASNGNQAAVNAAQANTNTVMQLQTAENRRVASTGTAIVAAAAAIPALEAGKTMGFGAAVGTYDGRSAISVAFAARVSAAAQIKLHIGTGSSGKVAAGAGGMWSW